MQYDVTLGHDGDDYVAECPSMGLASRGLSPTNALDALKQEIRYNIEFCPCTSVDEGEIELSVTGDQ